MSKRDVVFVDGVRTAFGTLGRTLRNFTMEQLGGIAIKGLLAKTKIIEKGAHVDSVFAGSAIDSINHAAWRIIAGQADIMIAGGMESYSQACAKFPMSTEPFRMIPPLPIAPTLSPFPEECIGMGLTAENLQKQYNISRQAQDEFGLRSQILAKKAMDAGYFVDEIIPVMVPQGKKKPPLEFKVDEHPRTTSIEALSALSPAFIKDGTVTAGNASGRK